MFSFFPNILDLVFGYYLDVQGFFKVMRGSSRPSVTSDRSLLTTLIRHSAHRLDGPLLLISLGDVSPMTVSLFRSTCEQKRKHTWKQHMKLTADNTLTCGDRKERL